MALTLGASVNRGLRAIGEVDITEFDVTDILQNLLIDDANETVNDLLEATRHRWGLHRDYFTTVDALTTGAVTITKDSTTVTSVSATGGAVAADNFTEVAVGQFLRRSTDLTSYRISSIDVDSSPDTLVLEDAYLGVTAADGVAYTILQDTYPLTITDIDQIQKVRYGEAPSIQDNIHLVDMQTILNLSQGDLHRSTSGLPTHMARVNPDTNDNPQYVLWPYPDTAYLIEVWYSIKFSNSTFGTNMFGGDAPEIFYDAIAHHMRWRACTYDDDHRQADKWMSAYVRARGQCVARDNQTSTEDGQISIQTYGRSMGRRGRRGQSQIAFDRS